MNISIVRLITGEDLLCEVLTTGPETIKIKNAVRIVVLPNQKDPRQPSIGLAPWFEFAAPKEHILSREHVLVVSDPIQEFKTQYQQMFGGLILPDRQLILPSE